MDTLGPRAVDSAREQGQWRARPVAATAVRATTTGAPVVAAVGAAVVVTRWWPKPDSTAAQLAWWMASVVAASLASYATARMARRLLPLAALLKLSLTFPDRTPSRFGLALRAGGVSDLKARGERLANADLPLAEAVHEALVLATALTHHDRATQGHSERVRAMTEVLAEELGLSARDRDQLRWTGLLHDVGKVTVPSEILNKPGPLDDDEWVVMRSHAEASGRLVAPLRPWLGQWTDAVAQHHERFDGTGYPHGLRGEEINLGARIVAVADTFDVMTATRSYKRPVPAVAAREEISVHAGDLFDPVVARALLNVSLGRLRWITGPLLWIVASPFVAKARAVAASANAAAPGSIAGATAGVLAAALAVAPPAVTPARAPVVTAMPQATAVIPSAALPMPQTAAVVAPPTTAAAPVTAPAVAPPIVAAAAAPASRPPTSVVAPAPQPARAAAPATGPTKASAPPPLVAVEIDLGLATAAVEVDAPPSSSPVNATAQIGPLPPITIGRKR